MPLRVLAPTVAMLAVAAATMLPALAESRNAPEDEAASWMNEAEIKEAFGGQVIDGHYRNGRTFNERYGNDGRIAYRDDFRSSGGHWSLVNGSFCTIYDGDASGGCFRVKRSGANCFEFYFVARTEDEAKRPRLPDWTARGWRSNARSTCVDAANA